MAVVISDTTPLHYLVLIGRDSILQKLYGEIIVPPRIGRAWAAPLPVNNLATTRITFARGKAGCHQH